MKITALLLIIGIVQVSASSFAQKVTINQKNIPLEQIFRQIRDQSGYNILIDADLLKNTKPVSLSVKQVSLEEALDVALHDQPLEYTIKEKTVIVKSKEKGFFEHIIARFQAIDVRGKVVDENDQPVPGATVKLKDGSQITLTDKDGYFSFKRVNDNAVVVISSIGFDSKEVPAAADMGSIRLSVSTSKLDEIHVVGYGTTTERLSTGSIAKVNASQIEKSPASNPILSLEGRIAGVSVTENSGAAGSGFSISIRGQNTIAAGKLPLYIIDGVPFDGKAVERNSSASASPPSTVGANGFNPLNVLTPDMIESIEVLKDADATAIYGSRAANGVVVITTKTGKAGATKLAANIYSGVSSITRTLPMLDASQYISMRQKAFANDNIIPTALNAPDLVSFAPEWNTNYQDYFFNTGHFTNTTLSLSGGNEETQFLVSGSYRYESPVFDGNFADKIAHAKMSIVHTSKDKRFNLNASANYAADNNVLPQFDLYNVYALPPNLPLYNNSGNLAWYTGFTNPLSYLINPVIQNNKDVLGNLSFSYKIVDGLSFKTDAGYHTTDVENITPTFKASMDPSSAASTGLVFANYTNIKLYNVEPQLTYTTKVSKGQLQVLVGATYQYDNAVTPTVYLGSFASDALYQNLGSLTLYLASSSFSERKYFSAFGRVNYVWEDKYIINGNFRRDGSSAFAPGNRYGNFGSIGGAWIVSEEDFLKNQSSWLSFLKLRSSYGSIGNDQIPAYGYLSYYSSGTAYSGIPSLNPARLNNDNNFSWEVTKKFEAAADLGFLKDRILITASWYHGLTSNMLLPTVPIAGQTGFNGYTGNVNGLKVENKGFEFSLNSTNVQSKAFKWQTYFNFATNKNTVVSFPNLASSSYSTGSVSRTFGTSGIVVGQPINVLYGYQLTGFNNGIPTFLDANGDGKLSSGLNANGKGDYVVLGSSDPKFYGGFGNTFTYKQLQLDFLFQFAKKENYNVYRAASSAPGSNVNQPADILNYPFVYSSVASSTASLAFANFAQSSATISGASYIRLKNISLSYSLPEQWLSRLHLQNTSVFLRGQNLLTFTRYKGFDPENFGATLPLNKMVTLGLQTSL